MSENTTFSKAHATQAFQDQLQEATKFALPAHKIESSKNLLSVPRKWQEEITIGIYLEEFLARQPHLRAAKDNPAVRQAIRVDLENKGLI